MAQSHELRESEEILKNLERENKSKDEKVNLLNETLRLFQ
jgi:hypothetical protein